VRNTRGGVSIVTKALVTRQQTSKWDSKQRGPMIIDPGVPRTSPLGDRSVLKYLSQATLKVGYHSKPTWQRTSLSMKNFEGCFQNASYIAKGVTWWLMSKLPSTHHVQNLTKKRSEYTWNGVLSAPTNRTHYILVAKMDTQTLGQLNRPFT
jgi:hypothetical protein